MSHSALQLTTLDLYESDETAWLEQTARLLVEGRFGEIDTNQLSEFLLAMAIRDKREVLSRLIVLLAHLLKWEYQPTLRSSSWQATIAHQKYELFDLLESGTLRRHAEETLGLAYKRAIREASIETGLPDETFPAVCPFTIESLIAINE